MCGWPLCWNCAGAVLAAIGISPRSPRDRATAPILRHARREGLGCLAPEARRPSTSRESRLQLGPVKSAAGRRDLPLLPLASEVLDLRIQAQAADRAELGRAWIDNGLVFTTRTGRPVEPRNLARSFHRICTGNRLRNIKLHHLRHTTATLLKNLGVPARDAQLIFGHSRLAVMLEIYSHEDKEAHRQAPTKIGLALREQPDEEL